MQGDTIFALATARGKAGVAIIRVSGPQAFAGCERLVTSLPECHRAAIRQVSDIKGKFIDKALVLCFPEGASFTGEQIVEFHVHGSKAIISAVENALSDLPNYRPALAGEFTRRAMENGRLDLSQVEALADLIDAETEAQRVQALRAFDGGLTDLVQSLKSDLVDAIAYVEATIDFADEEVPVDVTMPVLERLDRASKILKREIDGSYIAERVRDGFEVAIIGPPNIGKSTLLNTISRRDVALTSEIAGTTRDVIEVRIDLNGLAVTLLDTAGWRETSDVLEAQGIDVMKLRARSADLRVHLGVRDNETVSELFQTGDIVVQGKGDLTPSAKKSVSGMSGDGVPELLAMIDEALSLKDLQPSVSLNLRHRDAFRRAFDEVDLVEKLVRGGGEAEIISAHLRLAVDHLQTVIGRVDADEVLGAIFGRFCIGK